MGRIRKCNDRCHHAKGSRCACWCGGVFHGSAGVAKRVALAQGGAKLLKRNGFKKGETAYIEQKEFPMEEYNVG